MRNGSLARNLEASEMCPQSAGMDKSIYSRQSHHLSESLVRLRKKAGMTQRELAKALEREHSFISRLELGERRVDLIEFFWICKACGADPKREASVLMRHFEQVSPGKSI